MIGEDAMRAKFEDVASDYGAWPNAVERSQSGVYKLMATEIAWSWWRIAVSKERERCAAICRSSDRYRGEYFAQKIEGEESAD